MKIKNVSFSPEQKTKEKHTRTTTEEQGQDVLVSYPLKKTSRLCPAPT